MEKSTWIDLTETQRVARLDKNMLEKPQRLGVSATGDERVKMTFYRVRVGELLSVCCDILTLCTILAKLSIQREIQVRSVK
jgi:hypothetical protein